MPFSYRIDPAAGLLFLTGEGTVTQQERLDALSTWLADPGFRPGLDALCDFSAAVSTPGLDELKGLLAVVRRHAQQIGQSRVAIVAPKPVTFGVARQFEALSRESPLVVGVFQDRVGAMLWLRGTVSVEEV